ncbi:MAG TPA: DUF2752 domain-containing protein [Verrucomicrobiae bacterium]|nr:DUF2752 domain-containing protein [Verrucomicrobiae bacterium]
MNAQTKSIPPRIAPRASLTLFSVMVSGAAILGVTTILFFFNPSTHHFYPVCMFHKTTGLNCPGCGGTRAFYALLHGHFAAAIRDNALCVLLLAASPFWVGWIAVKKLRGEEVRFDIPPKVSWTFLVVAIIFSVLRNLPEFSFLSP